MINYSKSSLAVISSILKYYHYHPQSPSLEVLDQYLNTNPQTVVLIVLDGLGSKILDYHSQNGYLNHHKVADISSVFPPTTVAAINTFESGLPPISHGWLGWSLYFKEYDRYFDIFLNRDSETGQLIDERIESGKELLKYRGVYSKIHASTNGGVRNYVIHPHHILRSGSDYDTFYAQKPTDTFKIIKELTKLKFPKYIYAYITEPDYTMHELGTKDEKIGSIIKELESHIEEDLNDCLDTLIIITADHGQIDVDEYIDLSQIEELKSCLLLKPFIESRCASFFVKDEKKAFFKDTFEKYFKDDFLLLSKEEVNRLNLFGEGTPHEKYHDFVGDFVGIALKNKCIIYQEGRSRDPLVFKGQHAGLTDDELTVPLIIIEKKMKE